MRFLTILLVLIFSLQSLTKADDISEFEIEGISVGKSVLDYFSKNELNNFPKQFYPSSDKYQGVEISKIKNNLNFSTYDSITLNWKKMIKK